MAIVDVKLISGFSVNENALQQVSYKLVFLRMAMHMHFVDDCTLLSFTWATYNLN